MGPAAIGFLVTAIKTTVISMAVSKIVGKVTGNETLGMIAGMIAGGYASGAIGGASQSVARAGVGVNGTSLGLGAGNVGGGAGAATGTASTGAIGLDGASLGLGAGTSAGGLGAAGGMSPVNVGLDGTSLGLGGGATTSIIPPPTPLLESTPSNAMTDISDGLSNGAQYIAGGLKDNIIDPVSNLVTGEGGGLDATQQIAGAGTVNPPTSNTLSPMQYMGGQMLQGVAPAMMSAYGKNESDKEAKEARQERLNKYQAIIDREAR